MNNKEFKASEILGIKDPSTILNYVRDWSSNLSEKEHIIKSVVQEIHQNCETRLDRIIYKLLTYCTPKGTTDTEIEKTEEDMWKEIGKMGFEQKYRLLKPILQNWKQVNPEVEVANINGIRRACTHMKDKNKKDKIQYKGHKIFSDPEGIANLFFDSWAIGKGLDKIWQWVADQHAYIDKGVKFAREQKAL